jgi:hypothetical protein
MIYQHANNNSKVMNTVEIVGNTRSDAQLSAAAIDSTAAKLKGAEPVVRINCTTELCMLDNFYCVKRNDNILAWIELGDDTVINGEDYHTVKVIYVLPEQQGTPIVSACLLALMGELEYPLILGNELFGYSSGVFKSGKELVNALGKNTRFEVSTLNIDTGKRTPVWSLTPFADSDLETNKHLPLVFEDGYFPLYKDGGDCLFCIFEDTGTA